MGTWGFENFENDAALDFVVRLVDGADLTPVEEAFDEVLENDDYIEVDSAQAAVAAAEVVAFLLGKPASDFPDDLRDWLQSHARTVDSKLAEKARRTVNKLFAASELQELWEDDSQWQAAIHDLLNRLQPA